MSVGVQKVMRAESCYLYKLFPPLLQTIKLKIILKPVTHAQPEITHPPIRRKIRRLEGPLVIRLITVLTFKIHLQYNLHIDKLVAYITHFTFNFLQCSQKLEMQIQTQKIFKDTCGLLTTVDFVLPLYTCAQHIAATTMTVENSAERLGYILYVLYCNCLQVQFSLRVTVQFKLRTKIN